MPPPSMLLLFLGSVLVPPVLLGTVEVTRPRGVSLTNHHFYDPSKPFTCLDGSSTIAFLWVNDDYCDCPDGSDEPGTAACPNGHFHCTNAGYRPQNIPSAYVNDGVCDCCDGTDEYSSGMDCGNTCKELGRQEREAQQRRAVVAREGYKLKQQLVQEAAASREQKQAHLGELQEQLKLQQQELSKKQQLQQAAEAQEKEALERHQQLAQEERAAAEALAETSQANQAFRELDTDQDGRLTAEELLAHPQLNLQQEEAQALLGLPVDPKSFQERIWASIKEQYLSQAPPDPSPPPSEPPLAETPPEEEEEEEEEEAEEEEEEEEEEEGENPEEELKVPPPQQPEVKGQQETPPEPPYDAATQALLDAAQRAREELQEAEKTLKETEEAIRALEQELAFDFGPQGEFSYLYHQCYELETSEYIYRLCPFKRVSQKPKQGGTETNLGTWGSWVGPAHDPFSAMKYEHGTACWQGPNRATTVRLSCGTSTELTGTTEPNRCEYLMELQSPAACHAAPSPGGHDEL